MRRSIPGLERAKFRTLTSLGAPIFVPNALHISIKRLAQATRCKQFGAYLMHL